jgi:hypothetical protein
MDDRRISPLGLDRSRSEDRIQCEGRVRVVRRALDPAAKSVYRAGNQGQRRVAGRDLRVEESAVTAGTAVRREFQVAMKDLLEGAVGVRFPNGTAFTLGTFVKDRLASNRESQIHTPQGGNAGLLAPKPLLPAAATLNCIYAA